MSDNSKVVVAPNHISLYTGGKERLRITDDGRFLVNSIIEVDTKTEASKIYFAMRDVFVKDK